MTSCKWQEWGKRTCVVREGMECPRQRQLHGRVHASGRAPSPGPWPSASLRSVRDSHCASLLYELAVVTECSRTLSLQTEWLHQGVSCLRVSVGQGSGCDSAGCNLKAEVKTSARAALFPEAQPGKGFLPSLRDRWQFLVGSPTEGLGLLLTVRWRLPSRGSSSEPARGQPYSRM